MMGGKLSNPAPFGLAGFATTAWMLSMVNTGWFNSDAVGLAMAVAFVFGGTAQIVAGILEFPRGNTLGTVAFISYGSFWWSFALFTTFFSSNVPRAFLGWYLFVWGVITFYLWIAARHTTLSEQLVFLFLWMTYLLLAIGAWTEAVLFTRVGGYTGMLTALLAFYCSAAIVINETYGRTVLPTRPYIERP